MTEKQCTEPAAYRYTWPGLDESFICEDHVEKLRSVASGLGMHLQVIPLNNEEILRHKCRQEIRDGN